MTDQDHEEEKKSIDTTEYVRSPRKLYRQLATYTMEMVIVLAKYIVETSLAVGLFGILVLASRVTRLFTLAGGKTQIPEVATVLKGVEIFLFAIGVIVCATIVLRNTILLIIVLINDIQVALERKKLVIQSLRRRRLANE